VKAGPIRFWASAAIVAALAGCATPHTDAILADRGARPARAEIASVPFIAQERYYCGPASLAMALQWTGHAATQDEIAAQVYTPGRAGTLPTDLVAGARRNGRLAVPVGSLDLLLAELAAGHPVIVFQNLSLPILPQWHFAVAIGYDLETGEIILRSGRTERLAMPLSVFERTWERTGYWGLVVLPPNRLPARGNERELLRAAIGLEQADRPREAAIAYATIATSWPSSFGAQIGLGNALLAAGDSPGAERAFRRSIVLRPNAADAWNNLALALSRQFKHSEAMAAGATAVTIGGPNLDLYRQTLEQVSRRGA
jgi:tetratricopeptide (TPR) repeat protein